LVADPHPPAVPVAEGGAVRGGRQGEGGEFCVQVRGGRRRLKGANPSLIVAPVKTGA